MNNGFSSISKPSLNGLVDFNADVINYALITLQTYGAPNTVQYTRIA